MEKPDNLIGTLKDQQAASIIRDRRIEDNLLAELNSVKTEILGNAKRIETANADLKRSLSEILRKLELRALTDSSEHTETELKLNAVVQKLKGTNTCPSWVEPVLKVIKWLLRT